MKTLVLPLIYASFGLLWVTTATAQTCGKVTIAEMKWGSAAIAASLDKIVLEAGFGCKVEIVPGDTMPTFEAMRAKSQPDIAPELWVTGLKLELDKAISAGRVVKGAEILAEGAIEGWWIPKFIADANPDIRSVTDALKRPDIFPAPDGSGKGAVFNCPVGWSCKITTQNLYKAFNADSRGFKLVNTESAQALDDSIADAFESKKGWLGFYWAPTAILGKYEMTRLGMGVQHHKAEWDACTSVSGCEHPQINAYPVSQAFTLMTKPFADRAGPAMGYLKKRAWDNRTINDVLAWQDENRKGNRDAAIYFLETYEDLWTKWVARGYRAEREGGVLGPEHSPSV